MDSFEFRSPTRAPYTFYTPSSSSPQSPPWSPFPAPTTEPIGLPLQQVSARPISTWNMQQPHHQCVILEDREMLDADIEFVQKVHEPQPCLLIKLGSEPHIGLEFCSEGEAYEYYRAYAKENGFSIRKSHVERSRVDHSLISRKFVCVRQGFRSLKDKRYEGKVVRHRQVTRVDCRAAMIIKRRCGKWVVHRFHKEHNHDLGDSASSCERQAPRKMEDSTKTILQALYKTQCIDIEDTISRGQKISDCNMVASNSIQEPQPTICVQESLDEDVVTTDMRREDKYVKGPPNEDINAAENSERGDNDASLIKLGSEPYLGLKFGSQDEAYEFYNAYAKEKGFSIRKSRIERSRIDQSMISRLYVCANQGLRSTKDKRYEGKVVRPRQETRLDCRAAMFIKRRFGKWVVERFQKEHNHDLVDPSKAEKLRSHRKMTMATKSMIEALYKCGVGPSNIVDILTGVADGAKDIPGSNGENIILGNNEKDCENNIKKGRKNNIRVECYSLLDYFQRTQATDPGFFYAVEFGENRSMRSILWADSKAREAYKQFGDVLVFDTVCRTNKYLFPFASFIGLNRHRQAVLFGCGFLADETIESFVWFFQTWLRAMSNRSPSSIITNQDKSMKVAIEKVFPESRHRFCMWNIEKDELENLAHVFDMHNNFHSEYKMCIYNTWTPKEFELGWEALLMKYNLKDNKWLNKLFNQRQHWVPLYLRDTFFGGITTTQKSEGMHCYFDGFLHGETTFNDFVPQYEQAVRQHREEEADEDFLSVFTSEALTSKNPIEGQAARIYTRNMFAKFQNEFIESSGCTARKIGEEGPIKKYLVGKYRDKDDRMHIVTYDPTENNAICSCQMFQSEGMLCRHVLKVFQVVDVFEIPAQYILERWIMNNRFVESTSNEAGAGCGDRNTISIWTLKGKTHKFVEFGETSYERINFATSILQEGMRKLSLISVPTVSVQPDNLGCNSIQAENIDEHTCMMDLNITVPDPPRGKPKSRLVSSRIKLGIVQAQKKKRACGTCKETGHYTRTCPKGSVDQSQASKMLQGPVVNSQASSILQGVIHQSQSSPLSLRSTLLQGNDDHSETSDILHGSLDQSQTSMMLQDHFGQPQIFAML